MTRYDSSPGPQEPAACYRSRTDFADCVTAWQRKHGRHHLPWQDTRDPYAVWVAEIMLQQTRVATVIPYFRRFMAFFPDLMALANADPDEVLRCWSGLGYYSRARNLHAATRAILARHGGQFPRDPSTIAALPGIGRSTAAAIAVFAFGARCAILDGNVKRVLARCFGVEGWPGLPAVEARLWRLAESLLPAADIAAYTQGLMDLGATVCTRSKPTCAACPLARQCLALRDGRVHELPAHPPRKVLPQKTIVMLLFCHGSAILLEKRPPNGIWGGLWSLPETVPDADVKEIARLRFGLDAQVLKPLPSHLHTFTHFRLKIIPQPLLVVSGYIAQDPGILWLDRIEASSAAVPAPVRKILRGKLTCYL